MTRHSVRAIAAAIALALIAPKTGLADNTAVSDGWWANGTDLIMNQPTYCQLGIGTADPEGKAEIYYKDALKHGLLMTYYFESGGSIPLKSGLAARLPDMRLRPVDANERFLLLGRTINKMTGTVPAGTQNPDVQYRLLLSSDGKLGVNMHTFAPRAALDVLGGGSNGPTAMFGSASGRHIDFCNVLLPGNYSELTRTGDQGVFWTDGLGTYDGESGKIEGTNKSSGLVIAPWTQGLGGLRISNEEVHVSNNLAIGKPDYRWLFHTQTWMDKPDFITIAPESKGVPPGWNFSRALTLYRDDGVCLGGDVAKVGMGPALGEALGYGTSYLGFNSFRRQGTWELHGDGAHNGGAAIYSDVGGTIHFAPIASSGGWTQTLTDADVRARRAMTVAASGDVRVKGLLVAKEVEVTLDGFYDRVFDEDYDLMPIDELERYVRANRHLPDVPPESVVVANGLGLGQTNALLMKKVEELTLYVIDLKKEVERLRAAR